MSVGSIGEYIRQQREQAKISLRQLASAAGISNPYLSQIERGLRRPSAEILQQIAKALRISAEALYVQAGILEDRQPDSGVRAAVLADPYLMERQKQVLLEIYESFRRESSAARDPEEDAPRSIVTAVAEAAAGAPPEQADEAATEAAWHAVADPVAAGNGGKGQRPAGRDARQTTAAHRAGGPGKG